MEKVYRNTHKVTISSCYRLMNDYIRYLPYFATCNEKLSSATIAVHRIWIELTVKSDLYNFRLC